MSLKCWLASISFGYKFKSLLVEADFLIKNGFKHYILVKIVKKNQEII